MYVDFMSTLLPTYGFMGKMHIFIAADHFYSKLFRFAILPSTKLDSPRLKGSNSWPRLPGKYAYLRSWNSLTQENRLDSAVRVTDPAERRQLAAGDT